MLRVAFSGPDATRIAYSVQNNDRPGRPYSQVWIMDVATGKTVRLGSDKEAGDQKFTLSVEGLSGVLARDVIGRPMMPGARGRVRVVTEKDEASGLRRGAGPLERRGKVFTIASEAPRDRCTVYKGA